MTTTTITPTPSIRRSTAVTIAVAAAVIAAGTALVVPRLNVETAGSAARPTATEAALPAAQAAVITEGNALDRKMDVDHRKQTALAASTRVPDGSDVAESNGHGATADPAFVPDASDVAEQNRLDRTMLIEAKKRAASSTPRGRR
jgi:hypothetical protein